MGEACGGAWEHPGGPGLELVVELPVGEVVNPALLQCEPE